MAIMTKFKAHQVRLTNEARAMVQGCRRCVECEKIAYDNEVTANRAAVRPREWNRTHNPGRLSRKAEVEEIR